MNAPSFADAILDYHWSLQPNWALPEGFHLLYPYDVPATRAAMEAFYRKYYQDQLPRVYLFGINPGRFGAGITGIPFTDPIRLTGVCGIPHAFEHKPELSSEFIYAVIEAYGGVEAFYRDVYITSLSPLGFTKAGKTGEVNVNYYDDKALFQYVKPHMLEHISTQIQFGLRGKAVLCLGEGQNYKFFQALNHTAQWFEQILPLPHPRWVMQYRRKHMMDYVHKYVDIINQLK